MSLKHPIISLQVMKKMFPAYEQEAEALARNGHWYFSVSEDKFLSYVSNVKMCIHDVEPASFQAADVSFKLRSLSSVYEVTVDGKFSSSLLLAQNLAEIVNQYLDITDDTYVVVLDNASAPIIIGNRIALERFVFPSWEDAYIMKPLKEFLKKGEE